MKIKYVVVRGEFGREEMIVFSETMKHSHVVRDALVISAGFLDMTDNLGKGFLDPKAYGKSVSLRVESRPEEDTKIAKRLFNV